MRIMPYRTLENRINGVVITFADITFSKTLEAELRKTQAALEKRIGEQKAELECSEERFQAEIKRGKNEKMAGATGARRKGVKTP